MNNDWDIFTKYENIPQFDENATFYQSLEDELDDIKIDIVHAIYNHDRQKAIDLYWSALYSLGSYVDIEQELSFSILRKILSPYNWDEWFEEFENGTVSSN